MQLASENIPSPACLIVFVKSKTENQLIRFVIAYLVADNKVKCETVVATRDPRLHHARPMASYNSPDLNPGYVMYCSNLFTGNLLKQESRAAARKPRDAARVLFC